MGRRTTFALYLAASTALAAAATAAPAAQSAYPVRPVRLVVGFGVGGGTDLLARTIAPKLSEALRHTWVVDNRTGASGNLSTEIVVRANPDGHTILMVLNTQLSANPSLFKLPFSVQRDLQPITMLGASDQILVIHPGVPAHTLKEFIALAQQKPGAFNYASTGIGSVDHLGTELLNQRAGIKLVHVTYKGGGQASAALLAGEVQVRIGAAASTIPMVSSGRLRALAMASAKRSRLLPELPTVAELGYPGYEVNVWYALLAPAGTPSRIVERIRTETIKALQSADVQAQLERAGVSAQTSTPAELAQRVSSETMLLGALIKDLAIRVQ
ncbi:MAG: tripartite tricarboxylate transporter substrate binding protein [Burkholderiales bacterium]|nr:tripartite tricarboxylate transporter substrate binding protein [Burkholderiales bacterium]